jgi:hypothetical protein
MSSLASSPATGSGHPPANTLFSADPELRFLVAAISTPGKGSWNDLRPSMASSLDWARILRLAEHHGVTPALYRGGEEVVEAIPPAVISDLRGRYEHNARRNLRFTTELIRILDCLAAKGIEAIPYKGPVLAETVYRDLALREFSDLDVLVRAQDVGSAKEALGQLHYAPNLHLSPSQERAYLQSGYEYTFDGPNERNLLEIQWAIVPRYFAVDLAVEDLFARAAVVEVGGQKMQTLSLEDLFLVLCVHAAKHGWTRLCWLRDIAATAALPALNWNLLLGRAWGLGIGRIVDVSLGLADSLLGADVPPKVRDQVRADADGMKLIGPITRRIVESERYSTESIEHIRLMLQLRERVVDKMRFALRLAFTPSIGEWSVVSLPAPLFPLYRVIRLFRLAARFLAPSPAG